MWSCITQSSKVEHFFQYTFDICKRARTRVNDLTPKTTEIFAVQFSSSVSIHKEFVRVLHYILENLNWMTSFFILTINELML